MSMPQEVLHRGDDFGITHHEGVRDRQCQMVAHTSEARAFDAHESVVWLRSQMCRDQGQAPGAGDHAEFEGCRAECDWEPVALSNA